VVINLHRPAWDDFVVSTVHGGDTMRDALRGRSTRGTSGSSRWSKRERGDIRFAGAAA
jgi:hypothetical protein